MLDTRILTTLLLIGVTIVVLLLLWLGWRARRRSQHGVAAPAQVPADALATDEWDDVHYVATSEALRPLERITVPPLGFRGRADVAVVDDGLAVRVRGTRPFLIPTGSLLAVDAVTATIDRAVERNGLSAVRWTLGGDDDAVEVETTFRIVDRDERARFLARVGELISNASPKENTR